ncbi:hypothetical protein G6F59_017470 [Rhizopus arrhizus]|nr:hypothetical protein G6F59_017470 [Rhizopus arrhizus]
MAVPVEDIGNRRVITRQAPVGEGGPALFVARGADAEHQFMLAAQQREGPCGVQVHRRLLGASMPVGQPQARAGAGLPLTMALAVQSLANVCSRLPKTEVCLRL